MQSLALQTLRYSRLGFGTPQGIARSLRDWRAVARAVRRREPEKAAEIIRRRIEGSRDAALKALRAEQIERGGPPVEPGNEPQRPSRSPGPDGRRGSGPLRPTRGARPARESLRARGLAQG